MSDPEQGWRPQDEDEYDQDEVADADPAEEPDREPVYANPEAWLTGFLLPTWRRKEGTTFLWCRKWWSHPEAYARVQAMWLAWEKLRLDGGTGISDWWRQHADHHLPLLHASNGPFNGCNTERGHTDYEVMPLPVDPAPEDLVDPYPSLDGPAG